MSKESLRSFRKALLKANGDAVEMKKTFKNISAYLASSISKKQDGQSPEDFLNHNPEIKRIHEWSDTVLVNSKYQLVNY